MPAFIPEFNPDPNYYSFPRSEHLPALSPELLTDQAQVAKLLAARSSQLAAPPATSLTQDTTLLVHRMSAAHALARKIALMAEGTQDEGNTKFLTVAAGRAEAAARAFAFLFGGKTLATSPHDVVFTASIGPAAFASFFGLRARSFI